MKTSTFLLIHMEVRFIREVWNQNVEILIAMPLVVK